MLFKLLNSSAFRWTILLLLAGRIEQEEENEHEKSDKRGEYGNIIWGCVRQESLVFIMQERSHRNLLISRVKAGFEKSPLTTVEL